MTPEARDRKLQQMRDWNAANVERVRAAQRRYNALHRAERAQACKDRRETLKTHQGWAQWLRT